MVIIIPCIGIVINQQMEMNNCLRSHTIARNEIGDLLERKGANEGKIKHVLLTLKEQAYQFLDQLFDRPIKDAKDCQILLRQLVQNVTASSHL